MARPLPCDYEGCTDDAAYMVTSLEDGEVTTMCAPHYGAFVVALANSIAPPMDTKRGDADAPLPEESPNGTWPHTEHVRPRGPGSSRARRKKAETVARLQAGAAGADPDSDDEDGDDGDQAQGEETEPETRH